MTLFLFDDDACQSKGEGITRTTAPGAALWHYEVRLDRMRPMRGTIRAISSTQAMKFIQARHPNAIEVTVHGTCR